MSPANPPPPYPSPRRVRRPGPRRSMAWTIGRVAGIELRVHVSFLVLVAFVAVGATTPGQPSVIEQVAWIVVLFACVIAHEFAHSLVARGRGIAVHEIELLPIGGLSKLESRPRSWHDELVIAAAGPITSLGIGAALALVASAAGQPPWPIALYGGSFVTRIVWVNVLLGAFNLLPALPLDGGRVFRALLTPRVGHARATRLAAEAGRASAYALVAIGILFNFWIAAIGVFVLLGAIGEEAALRVELLLGPTTVAELPLRPPTAADADAPAVDSGTRVVDSPLLTGARSVRVVRDGSTIGVAHVADVDRLVRARAGRRSQVAPPDRPDAVGRPALAPPQATAQDRDRPRVQWRRRHASQGR